MNRSQTRNRQRLQCVAIDETGDNVRIRYMVVRISLTLALQLGYLKLAEMVLNSKKVIQRSCLPTVLDLLPDPTVKWRQQRQVRLQGG